MSCHTSNQNQATSCGCTPLINNETDYLFTQKLVWKPTVYDRKACQANMPTILNQYMATTPKMLLTNASLFHYWIQDLCELEFIVGVSKNESISPVYINLDYADILASVSEPSLNISLCTSDLLPGAFTFLPNETSTNQDCAGICRYPTQCQENVDQTNFTCTCPLGYTSLGSLPDVSCVNEFCSHCGAHTRCILRGGTMSTCLPDDEYIVDSVFKTRKVDKVIARASLEIQCNNKAQISVLEAEWYEVLTSYLRYNQIANVHLKSLAAPNTCLLEFRFVETDCSSLGCESTNLLQKKFAALLASESIFTSTYTPGTFKVVAMFKSVINKTEFIAGSITVFVLCFLVALLFAYNGYNNLTYAMDNAVFVIEIILAVGTVVTSWFLISNIDSSQSNWSSLVAALTFCFALDLIIDLTVTLYMIFVQSALKHINKKADSIVLILGVSLLSIFNASFFQIFYNGLLPLRYSSPLNSGVSVLLTYVNIMNFILQLFMLGLTAALLDRFSAYSIAHLLIAYQVIYILAMAPIVYKSIRALFSKNA